MRSELMKAERQETSSRAPLSVALTEALSEPVTEPVTRLKAAERRRAPAVLSRCVCGRSKRPPHCDGSHRELYER